MLHLEAQYAGWRPAKEVPSGAVASVRNMHMGGPGSIQPIGGLMRLKPVCYVVIT